MRAIAALSLACNYYVKLLYIPSESNPSDAPSRGKHRHRNEGSQKRATKVKSHFGTKSDRVRSSHLKAAESLSLGFHGSDCRP